MFKQPWIIKKSSSLSSHSFLLFNKWHKGEKKKWQNGCYNKEQIPFLYSLINCISPRSTPQLWHGKGMVKNCYFVSEVLFEWISNFFYAVFKTKIMKHLNSIPLSPRVAIRQPNDRPNKLLYFKTFKWYDNGILAR